MNLVSRSYNEKIKLWDLMTRKLKYTLERHTHWVTSLATFQSSGNNFLASGSYDETIKPWNLSDFTLISTLSPIVRDYNEVD